MTHNSIQRTLSANDYAYAPNDALGDVHAHDEEVAAAAESLDEDAKLINAIGNNEDDTSDAFDANAENKEFAQLEAEAAFAAASEEATVAANAAVRRHFERSFVHRQLLGEEIEGCRLHGFTRRV